MFLTQTELQDLTGYQFPAYQRRWLSKHGWHFEVSAMGRPVVLRAYAEKRMGLASAKPVSQTEPDFSHWGARAA